MDLKLFNRFQSVTIIYFKDYIVPSLASGSLVKMFLSSFDRILIVFDSFLAIWYDKMFSTHLVHFLSRSGINQFLKRL